MVRCRGTTNRSKLLAVSNSSPVYLLSVSPLGWERYLSNQLTKANMADRRCPTNICGEGDMGRKGSREEVKKGEGSGGVEMG